MPAAAPELPSSDDLARRKLAAEVAKLELEAAALHRPWRSSQFAAALLGGSITIIMGMVTFWQGTIRLNAAESARAAAAAELKKASEENAQLREQARRLQGAAEELATARAQPTAASANGSAPRPAGGDAINQAYVASAQVLAQAQPGAAAEPRPVVYIQYGEAPEAELAARLRTGLRAAGQFIVPPPERVGEARMPASAELRYFRAEDAAAAQRVAAELATLGINARPVSLAGKPVAANAKPGTIELWLARAAAAPAPAPDATKKIPTPVAPGSPKAW